MSSAHGATAPVDRLRGAASSLSAEAKLVGLVAFLVVVAVTPASAPRVLALHGAIAVLVAVVSFVEWGAVARRLTLDIPLVVLAATYALAGRAPHTELLGVTVSEAGLQVGLAILAKGVIGIVAVSALAASTTMTETVAALGRLGAPRWFCQMVALAARQLDVLRDDFARLRLAAEVRSASIRRRTVIGVATRSLGSLFVRATERADRLQLAAELRGGTGLAGDATPAPATAPIEPAHWLVALVPTAVAVSLLVGLGP